jgi:zinc D-Ala-D-Ala carboxypeptidase
MNRHYPLPLLAVILAAATAAASGCSKEEPQALPTAVQTPAVSPTISAAPPSPAKGKDDTIHAITFDRNEATVAPGSSRTLDVKALNVKQETISLADRSALVFRSDKPDIIAVGADGTVKAGPKAATGTSAVITAEYKGKTASVKVHIKYALEDTIAVSNGKALVTNQLDIAVVVNKKRALPESFAPTDLTEPQVPFSFSEKNEKRMLRKEAALALEKLFKLASQDGIKLYGISGYRSYATQKSVYNSNVKNQGQAAADKVSAQPGNSEHQTGLAIDVSSASAKFGLEESFGSTAEGKWLAAHAHEAGFIIRYPKGKESITGYSYEPWHIRYVGMDMAREILDNKWTLEEYFQDAIPVNG